MREGWRREGGEERCVGGWPGEAEEREGCEETLQDCGEREGVGPGLGQRGGLGEELRRCETSNSPASASPPERSPASGCSSWPAGAWLFCSAFGLTGSVHTE